MTKVKEPSFSIANKKLIRYTKDLVSFFDSEAIVKISTKSINIKTNELNLDDLYHLEKLLNWWIEIKNLDYKEVIKIKIINK